MGFHSSLLIFVAKDFHVSLPIRDEIFRITIRDDGYLEVCSLWSKFCSSKVMVILGYPQDTERSEDLHLFLAQAFYHKVSSLSSLFHLYCLCPLSITHSSPADPRAIAP